ncbi:ATP-grasp domain-containing protein [Aequorivita todarodis]|uniref:carboxylate--amine ligase n=1 Tax=Aequorivita todarodis TaxID=2036821 RepID=UPI0023509853|nr:ATP-grasp domain-containing protein [Aequorivita todarodis]MDC8001205.1 ATP-grasp domain-containing protein [Aequorivita todarodis]
MINVGILDGQSVQALIFAKQLAKAGYKVVLFCDSKLSYGYHTKYAHKKVLCPSTQKQTSIFHEFFLNYLENEKLEVVLPMNDYSAKYLSEYKPILQDKVKFVIPDFSVFMKGYDKNQLMKVCAENGIPHPKTIDISTLEKGAEPDFNFPALVKPNETTGARGFRKVESFEELWKVYEPIFKEFGNCHLQELIPEGGMQYKVQLLIKDQIGINSTVIEKHRYYPINGGSSCFNHTVVNDELVKICTEVLRILGWEGFADFDLIEDPRNGIIKIMEINPRAPACIKASVISGVDFPNAIVDLSLHKPVKTYTYKPDKYLRYFSMDLLWLISQKSKWKGFKEWKKQLFSNRHFLQDGELFDPLPFIVGACSGIAKQINPRFRASKKGMNQ